MKREDRGADMILRELEGVIEEDTTIALTTSDNTGLPMVFTSWAECKECLTEEAWGSIVTLSSYGSILITLELERVEKA